MEDFSKIKILCDKSDTVKGPNDNWMIDVEGNCYLAGRLCVGGNIDPQFLTLVDQTGSAGVPVNSILTLNDGLCLKDSGSDVHQIVPLRIRCRTTSTNSTGGIAIGGTDTTILSLTITPSSNSVRILVQAAWTGNTVGGDKGTPTIKLKSSTTQLAIYSQGTNTSGTRTQPFGGAIAVFDTASGTAQRTYLLTMSETLNGAWEINHASIGLIEVQADT